MGKGSFHHRARFERRKQQNDEFLARLQFPSLQPSPNSVTLRSFASPRIPHRMRHTDRRHAMSSTGEAERTVFRPPILRRMRDHHWEGGVITRRWLVTPLETQHSRRCAAPRRVHEEDAILTPTTTQGFRRRGSS